MNVALILLLCFVMARIRAAVVIFALLLYWLWRRPRTPPPPPRLGDSPEDDEDPDDSGDRWSRPEWENRDWLQQWYRDAGYIVDKPNPNEAA